MGHNKTRQIFPADHDEKTHQFFPSAATQKLVNFFLCSDAKTHHIFSVGRSKKNSSNFRRRTQQKTRQKFFKLVKPKIFRRPSRIQKKRSKFQKQNMPQYMSKICHNCQPKNEIWLTIVFRRPIYPFRPLLFVGATFGFPLAQISAFPWRTPRHCVGVTIGFPLEQTATF